MKRKQEKKLLLGMTLVEVLVVIGVLGVLISGIVILINPRRQIAKAKNASKKNTLHQLQTALEQYYNDNGRYPLSINYEIDDVNWGQPWEPYVNKLPKGSYRYVADSNGEWYRLYVNLQYGRDDAEACSGACPNVPIASYNDPLNIYPTPGSSRRLTCAPCTKRYDLVGNEVGLSCTSCNYGVSSPNTSP